MIFASLLGLNGLAGDYVWVLEKRKCTAVAIRPRGAGELDLFGCLVAGRRFGMKAWRTAKVQKIVAIVRSACGRFRTMREYGVWIRRLRTTRSLWLAAIKHPFTPAQQVLLLASRVCITTLYMGRYRDGIGALWRHCSWSLFGGRWGRGTPQGSIWMREFLNVWGCGEVSLDFMGERGPVSGWSVRAAELSRAGARW